MGKVFTCDRELNHGDVLCFCEILRISETKFIEEKIQGQLEQYSNIIVSATKQDLLEQDTQRLENTVLTITHNIPSLAHLCFIIEIIKKCFNGKCR